jgi:hypothetical protein
VNAPTVIWLILWDWVEELSAVDGLVASYQTFLIFALHFSEVLPAA